MGQYTAHGYLYKPSYGETGRDTTSKFNGGLDLVDAYMAGEAFSAPDFVTYTLAEIVAAIGSDPATIYFPSSTININENTTVPATIVCIIPNGGILHVANDVTLTVNGYIDAGPYQIFSWTGTGAIDLSSNKVIRDVPLEWFGAESGIGNDIYAVLTKINNSVGPNQTIYFNPGVWRIATTVDLTKDIAPVRLKGHSKYDSLIYIDVGGSDPGIIVYGDSVNAPSGNNYFSIEDISLVGPATCCTNALYLVQVHDTYFNNFNCYLGSTSYAVRISGCINVHGTIAIRRSCSGSGSYAVPNDGILVETSDTPFSVYQSNVTDLKVDVGQTGGTGVFYDGTNYEIGIMKISGIIELCEDYYFRAYNITQLNIDRLYTEAAPASATIADILLDKCSSVTINNLLLNDYVGYLRLHQCSSLTLNNFFIPNAHIRGDCWNITIGNGTCLESAGAGGVFLNDFPGTNFTGTVICSDGGYPQIYGQPSQSTDKNNLVYNSALIRWDATDPIGFTHSATATITQEDAIIHNAPHSLKVVTQGADSYDTVTWTADATQLKLVKGKAVVISWWVYAPTQANLSDECVSMIADGVTVPTRGDSTAYIIGDEVNVNSSRWLCIAAGTSDDSAPADPANAGDLITDGTVTWVKIQFGVTNPRFYSSSDAGKWKKIQSNVFIPNNTTTFTFVTYLHDLSTGGAATYYLTEPTVVIGSIGTSGYVPGQNEALSFLQIGANKISYGTAVPASGWCQQGDIVWRTDATAAQSPGWICTTSGVGGAGAVWKAMANVAA